MVVPKGCGGGGGGGVVAKGCGGVVELAYIEEE